MGGWVATAICYVLLAICHLLLPRNCVYDLVPCVLRAACCVLRAACCWPRTGSDEGARAKLIEDDRLQLGRIDGDEEPRGGAESGPHTLEAAHLVSGE